LGVYDDIQALVEKHDIVQKLSTLLLRERRFGRPRSGSVGHALDAVVQIIKPSPESFWPSKLNPDLVSAITMIVEAHTRESGSTPSGRDAVAVADDAVWLLSGLSSQGVADLQRLVRPLIIQLEHANTASRRLNTARTIAKFAKDTSLATLFVHAGGIKIASNCCLVEKDSESVAELGLLLGQLIVSCPEKAQQEAIASSECLKVLIDALSTTASPSLSKALAMLALGGGKPVRTALFNTPGALEAISGNVHSLLIVARLAAVDEFREQLIGHLPTCRDALNAKEPEGVRAAVELLAHLSTVSHLDEDLVMLVKDVVVNESFPSETRVLGLDVLWSAAHFSDSALSLASSLNEWLPALIVSSPAGQHGAVCLLERLCAASSVVPSEVVLTNLIGVLKAPSDNEGPGLAALESMCATSFATRKAVRELQNGALIKVIFYICSSHPIILRR